MATKTPPALQQLIDRYDPEVFELGRATARVPAYRSGRLRVRHDLHLGVGFLAATAAPGNGQLRCSHVPQLERPKETHAALADFFG